MQPWGRGFEPPQVHQPFQRLAKSRRVHVINLKGCPILALCARVGLLEVLRQIHLQQGGSHFPVEIETRPRPVLWLADQFAFDGVPVHVLELFVLLLFGEHIEIVEAALPEAAQRACVGIPQCQLRRVASAGLAAQPPRDALLEDLHYCRGRAGRGLADQQVHVLRHNHVADDAELVLAANFPENPYEHVACPRRAQQRQSTITTAGDEMKMALAVITLQSLRHRNPACNATAHPCKKRKDGAPRGAPSLLNLSPTNSIIAGMTGKTSRKGWATRRSMLGNFKN